MTLKNYIVPDMRSFPREGLCGRRKILTPVKEVNAGNVRDILNAALPVHAQTASEVTYLWQYYKGRQDICDKEKIARSEINNKVIVNHANEIVTFKTAYLLNEPIQYISAGGEEDISKKVNRLNEYMRAEDKESKDKEIVDWMHICGVAPRLVLPDEMTEDIDGAPFNIYTLDPREAFVIYNAGIGQKPVAGVILQLDERGKHFATVYTKTSCFRVTDKTVSEDGHILGGVPLIEYVNNEARMGAFEPVISLLNNINVMESNAVDSVQDFVNGFDVFQNCEIGNGDYGQLAIGGQAVMIKTTVPGAEAKVYRIASELSQSGVQTRIDDMTDKYLSICGMPNRNGGSSTSDTGQAVIFRDGWSEAESRAKDTEKVFTRSEREFLRIVLRICDLKTEGALDLRLSDIKTEFLRKNLSNMQSKVQVLCELLNNPMVHPKMAYEAAAAFKDNEEAYRLGMEHYETSKAEQEETIAKEIERERANAVLVSGQSDSAAQSSSGSQAVGGETPTAN